MASDKQVWLITGASRGLGRELARAVLARGEVVVGTSRDGKLDLEAGAGTLQGLALDLTKPGQEGHVIEQVYAHHGRLDVLVNNAGAGLLGAVEEATEAETDMVFAINFFGPLRLIRAALPRMRAAKQGHIVNLSSIAGLAPMAGSGLYAAAKFALEGMSESLAQEVAPHGIRVTVVEPGAFRTDFLSGSSIVHTARQDPAYAETSGAVGTRLRGMDGNQIGDPVRGAAAIIQVVDAPEPPLHLILGSDSLKRARIKLGQLAADFDRWEATALGTDFPAEAR